VLPSRRDLSPQTLEKSFWSVQKGKGSSCSHLRRDLREKDWCCPSPQGSAPPPSPSHEIESHFAPFSTPFSAASAAASSPLLTIAFLFTSPFTNSAISLVEGSSSRCVVHSVEILPPFPCPPPPPARERVLRATFSLPQPG